MVKGIAASHLLLVYTNTFVFSLALCPVTLLNSLSESMSFCYRGLVIQTFMPSACRESFISSFPVEMLLHIFLASWH